MRKEGSQGLGLREAISGTKRRRVQRRELAIEKAALELIEKVQIVRRVTEAVDRGENGIILHQGYNCNGKNKLMDILGIDQFYLDSHGFSTSQLSFNTSKLKLVPNIVMSEPSASISIHGTIKQDGVLFDDILNKISDLMDNEGISADWHWGVERTKGHERMICKPGTHTPFYRLRSAVTGKMLERRYKSWEAAEKAAAAAHNKAQREGKVHRKFEDISSVFVSLTLCWCPEETLV
jgi:hypothetical protein